MRETGVPAEHEVGEVVRKDFEQRVVRQQHVGQHTATRAIAEADVSKVFWLVLKRKTTRRSSRTRRRAIKRLAIAALIIPLAGDGDVEREQVRSRLRAKRSTIFAARHHCLRSAADTSSGKIRHDLRRLRKRRDAEQRRGDDVRARAEQPAAAPRQPRRDRRGAGHFLVAPEEKRDQHDRED